MDAGSLAALRELIALAGRSLLQYVSESSPFITSQTHDAFAQILVLAQEERDAVGKVVRYLQKKHATPILLGSYPSHYTMMNFITIDCLLPRLIAEQQKHVAEIAKLLPQVSNEEVHSLVQTFQEMLRRHLEALSALTTTALPAAS